ncbi:MAG: type 2 isopentenyl-diphosphate Delta-isomerase [Chloroflexi bacterium]|jgi:isopentenyl-diphosphate delta-isomerase|nr:type 2 isopentenyl-diphosphate Delta-isomerase [Chloroflexota bacterium]
MHHSQRKQDHLDITLQQDVASALPTGLDSIRLRHCALPDIALGDVDPVIDFLGHRLATPLLISSMTGGSPAGGRINHNLAMAAQTRGVALGLGSGRVALAEPDTLKTFDVRAIAPDIALYVNIGAVQLNYGLTQDDCRRLVDVLQADGLILHLNPLQEALQADGNTNFAGLLPKIAALCATLPVPVMVKEVGWGLSGATAAALATAGVAALDVAGAGGTSWSEVERHRADSAAAHDIALPFRDWGLTTVESLIEAVAICPQLPIIASGGIRTGVDALKCLALGARLVGMAGALLPAANQSAAAVEAAIDSFTAQLRVAMFATGVANLTSVDASILQRASHD